MLVSNINSEEPLHTFLIVQVSSGDKVLQLHPVCILIILEAGAEIVEDYLKLGRKAENSLVKFQQVLWKSDE